MEPNPALADFSRQIEILRRHLLLRSHFTGDKIRLRDLTLEDVAELIKDQGAAYYFLIAAAGLTRTTIKKAVVAPEARIVMRPLRRAFVIRERLPFEGRFVEISSAAILLRRGDLERQQRGTIEALFRERLAKEGIPLLMAPPIRRVPGILIGQRKPDGIYPDPALNLPPQVYLEIKNLRRVSDDIQKRLYEIAEASLEMKLLYGGLRIEGPQALTPRAVLSAPSPIQQELRRQIQMAAPAVVALLLCPQCEAERYRSGAQAFIDHVFFQEEIEECIACLKALLAAGSS